MKQPMKVILFDTKNKSSCLEYSLNERNQFIHKRTWTDKGFGKSQTERAEVDGVEICGSFDPTCVM